MQLDLRATMLLGRIIVDDSHLLRGDLGPAPNIRYRFRSVGAEVEASLSYALTPKLSAYIGVFGNMTQGSGDITYGASLANNVGRYDADYFHSQRGMQLGLSANF